MQPGVSQAPANPRNGETCQTISAEQKRHALQAVLASETFARSDQLRSFLKYVGEMAIEGRSCDVSEYSIAVEALGRPSGFSPSGDSSVRSRAHELRRKLQKYYETEAPSGLPRIELPKGSYTTRFIVPVEMPVGEAPARSAPPAKRRLAFFFGLTAVVGILTGAIASRLVGSDRSAGRVTPTLLEAWGSMARADGNVLMCVATNLHLVVRPYMRVVAEGLPKYPAPSELYPLYAQHRPLPAGLGLDMHPVDNSVQMGQMGAVVTLTGVLQSRGASFEVLPERSAPRTVMRGRNVILIGDPQNSAAAAAFLEKTPLTIDYDTATEDLVVRDRRNHRTYIPRRGPDNRYTDVYGLITVLRSPGAKSDQRTVVLSGITSVGTQGAAEFLASPADLEALRKRFRAEGLAGFPPAYQVIVHCKSQDTLLISEEYESHVTGN